MQKTGQVHALKIFDMRLASVSFKEIEALKSLKHENIVDFIQEDREVGDSVFPPFFQRRQFSDVLFESLEELVLSK